MTRKDYITLAQALFNSNPLGGSNESYRVWLNTRSEIALVLQRDNTNFNRHLFEYACYTGNVTARKIPVL